MIYQVDLQRIIDLIVRLDFIRVVGTEGERRGFEVITNELAACGVDAWFDSYWVPWVEIAEAQLQIEGACFPIVPLVSPVFNGPWIPISAEVDVQGMLVDDVRTEGVTGTRILLRTTADREQQCMPGADAQLFACPPDEGFVAHYLHAVSGLGRRIPSAWVDPGVLDALRERLGKSCRFHWTSRNSQKTLRNLLLDVRGTTSPDEVIGVAAHVDSFPGCSGANDNASGCARLIEFARWFRSHPPQRTIRFVWFTGEEAHVADCHAYLKTPGSGDVRLWIEVDGGVSDDHVRPDINIADHNVVARFTQEAIAAITSTDERILFRDPRKQAATDTDVPCAPIVWCPGGGRRKKLPAGHLPSDTMAAISRENLHTAAVLGLAFIDAVQKHRLPSGP